MSQTRTDSTDSIELPEPSGSVEYSNAFYDALAAMVRRLERTFSDNDDVTIKRINNKSNKDVVWFEAGTVLADTAVANALSDTNYEYDSLAVARNGNIGVSITHTDA